MATQKQIEANRHNAQKSTGPKTPEGKAAVAQNAIKHGLYTWTLLLPEEDPAKYEALCDEYVAHYQPEGLEEIELVEQLVTGKWELTRLNLMKQGVFNEAHRWIKKGRQASGSIRDGRAPLHGSRGHGTLPRGPVPHQPDGRPHPPPVRPCEARVAKAPAAKSEYSPSRTRSRSRTLNRSRGPPVKLPT